MFPRITLHSLVIARKIDLLVYPFLEWYYDSDLEYKPSELGYGVDQDYRGRYRASEGLLWRVVALIEGNQIDEVSLITEMQWRFRPGAVLKVNNGIGLTRNATGFAPEVGIMFVF